MKYLTTLIIFTFILFSCQDDILTDQAIVSGSLQGASMKQVILEELKTGRLIKVDSAKIDTQGNFQLRVLPAEKSFYLLHIGDFPAISIVLDKQDSLFISADTSQIFRTYDISGNDGSEILKKNYEQTARTKSVIDSLRQVLFESQYKEDFPEVKKSIDSTLEVALVNHRETTRELILQNPGNMANLLLINGNIAGRQIFNIDEDAGLYTQIENSLLAKYPDNSHVKMHTRRMEAWRDQMAEKKKAEERLEVGKPVPQITLPDENGTERSLSEFAGKNVILFFWASWSPESRADIQMLKSKYTNLKNQGLDIFAVSLDHKAQFWEAAINTENLKWVNVSDLAGPGSHVAELFNVMGKVPYYFLIDKQGRIKAKTRDFSELMDSVDSLNHKSHL